MYMDFVRNKDREDFSSSAVQQYRDVRPEETYEDATLEKVFRSVSEKLYKDKVLPGTLVSTNTGNCYCGSAYSSLLSLLANVGSDALLGKRIIMFSYGSGLASSMFTIRVKRPIDHILSNTRIMERLAARTRMAPEEYVKHMDVGVRGGRPTFGRA